MNENGEWSSRRLMSDISDRRRHTSGDCWLFRKGFISRRIERVVMGLLKTVPRGHIGLKSWSCFCNCHSSQTFFLEYWWTPCFLPIHKNKDGHNLEAAWCYAAPEIPSARSGPVKVLLLGFYVLVRKCSRFPFLCSFGDNNDKIHHSD